MNITENARAVLEKRYLAKGADGAPVETVEEMFERVARAVAAPSKAFDQSADTHALAKRFYDMMTNLEFLPNSPTLMNAGRPLGQLSACFVLPVGDSMDEIFEAVKQAALIHKSGGGTGFSFSRLRPKGSTVNSTGGVASGPISFMRVFNTATEAVKQGGTRRGANMGILRVDHPDILEFINCKENTSEMTNFNISVAITDAFMQAVEEGRDYDLIDPRSKEVTGSLSAREVFEQIALAAYRNGEPGIVFIDRINQENPLLEYGEIESTNPCGEQPLLPYESCNLGSINLLQMLKADGEQYRIDYDKMGRTVDLAIEFLDNVIEANRYPIKEIEEMTKKTRKIGLGVMGFADMLLKLKIPYSSEAGVKVAEEVMSFIQSRAQKKSEQLGELRCAFPLFAQSAFKGGALRRNATVTTIAPTGTLSIIAGCSSGVEPVFAFAYVRNVMDGTELYEVNPVLKEELLNRGLYTEELMKAITEQGSLKHIGELPEDLREVFVCAHDISPRWHVSMQAAFQKHTDNAVSKTVNFPHDSKPEDVELAFRLAYETGCKGLTVYRDGSRENQVLSVRQKGEKEAAGGAKNEVRPRPRPDVTMGFTEKVKIGCGNLYVTVNYDEQGICEIFTNTGRHGGCPSQSEATGRLASIALRAGMDVDTIIEQLKGIRCPSTIRRAGISVMSCPDAIARVMEKVKKANGDLKGASAAPLSALKAEPGEGGARPKTAACPECGEPVEHDGGCIVCRNCGYSKCN